MSPQASFFETVFAQSMDYGATDLLRYAVKTGCLGLSLRDRRRSELSRRLSKPCSTDTSQLSTRASLKPVLPESHCAGWSLQVRCELPRCSRRMPSIRRSGSAAPQSN